MKTLKMQLTFTVFPSCSPFAFLKSSPLPLRLAAVAMRGGCCKGFVYLVLLASFVALLVCNVHLFYTLPAADSNRVASESAYAAARLLGPSFDGEVLTQPTKAAVVLLLDLTPAPASPTAAPVVSSGTPRTNPEDKRTPPPPPPTVVPAGATVATTAPTAAAPAAVINPVNPTVQAPVVHGPASLDVTRRDLTPNNLALRQAAAAQALAEIAIGRIVSTEHPTVPDVPPVSFGTVQSMESIEGCVPQCRWFFIRVVTRSA
jgi:hypothetical protein